MADDSASGRTDRIEVESTYVEWRDAILGNPDLSLVARAFYLILDMLRRERERDTPDPSLEDLGAVLGVTRNTVSKAVKELVEADLLTVKRRGQGKPNLYTIHPQSLMRNICASRSAKSAGLSRGQAHGPSSSLREEELDQKLNPSRPVPDLGEGASKPPKTLKVDGRNLGFDALREVCGIVEGSPRERECIASINGSRKVGPGIREQFWREATQAGLTSAAVADDPELFERAVEEAIKQRALAYRAAMPGITMTPPALQKWWSDLPGMLQQRDGDSLAARMLRRADQLRQEGQ